MSARKYAFLLFTKAPTPGTVKTRLTKARGGIFTPHEAADFYQSALLDVVEIGFKALEELNAPGAMTVEENARYNFVISCPQPDDQRKLEGLLAQAMPWPGTIHFLIDNGATFGEHFDDAFHQLFDLGYYSVVAVGGDLPTMPVGHIIQAFHLLENYASQSGRGGFVHAPCQNGGVSLVGYTADTPMDSAGVYDDRGGISVLEGYTNKATRRGIPVIRLAPVADVDDLRDLLFTVSLLKENVRSTPAWRTLDWLQRSEIWAKIPHNTPRDLQEVAGI